MALLGRFVGDVLLAVVQSAGTSVHCLVYAGVALVAWLAARACKQCSSAIAAASCLVAVACVVDMQGVGCAGWQQLVSHVS